MTSQVTMTGGEKPLQFQILGANTKDAHGAYQITLFGSTQGGKSVSLKVTGFEPFFYVEIPDIWKTQDRTMYERFLLSHLADDQKGCVTITVEKHKTFWDFTNNQDFTFLKIQCRSKKVWTALRNICQDAETCIPIPVPMSVIRQGGKGSVKLRVFESNIDPLLRFFHMRELKPAGWAEILPDFWEEDDDTDTTTALQYTTEWDQIGPAPESVQLSSAPLRIMSWDIECTSSHGDFPLAHKTWRKPAREIVEMGLTDWDDVKEEILRAIQADAPIKCDGLSRIFLPVNGEREVKVALPRAETAWEDQGAASAIHNGTEDAIDIVDNILTKHFPPPEGDPIIQIGSVLYVNGKPVRKDIFVLGSCTRLPSPKGEGAAPIYTHSVATEAALIRGWCKTIEEQDPDIMMGYNIFGFDEKYLWDRAQVNRCTRALQAFGRTTDKPVRLQEKKLSSSAMGDNTFYVITGDGRLHIDLLAYVRRNAVLESYSLDNVTATFMSGGVSKMPAVATDEDLAKLMDLELAEGVDRNTIWTIPTKSTKGTSAGRYVVIMDEENDVIGEKLEVVAVTPKILFVRMDDRGEAIRDHGLPPIRWSQSKDDVSPKDIFFLHSQGPADRAKVAKYCIQDCDLVMELFQKLEVINNSIAMANVCWVPVDYIFTRGQGIKSESLVFYECRKEGQLIPVLPAPINNRPVANPADDCAVAAVPEVVMTDDNEGYEGAIVLNPISGIYLDDEPVAALDFSSLYPSSIISENLSHDSVVWVKDYDKQGSLVAVKEGSDEYDNLPGWEYLEVDYDILKPAPGDIRKHPVLVPSGRRVCRYAQSLDGSKSTLPKILMKLLSARKTTRKIAEKETDDFRKALLDAQQLAYKLTANSLYGQLGSNTSKIRRKCVAASTTGHGRQQLLFSKACIEAGYSKGADSRCDAVCVYGDTDSVFISFRPCDPVTGERLTGRPAQEAAKALAEEAGHKISGALKPPHDFEFDKMFRCFCLLSKKRYVGDMTEGGLEDDDYHRKSMGIVMKRRDNPPIVKYVYGGAIENILVKRDIVGAFQFVRGAVKDMLAGKFPMKKLIFSKSLRAEYKSVPAHKILADRIGKRDPGNKPSSNDRIPFVYFVPNGLSGKKLADVPQGERIETPAFIREKNLKPDYVFYITNQISNPVSQVFGLVVERLPGVKKHQLEEAARAKDPVAAREKLAAELLFGDMIRDAQREAAGMKDLRSFFAPVKK
jgi:DNA polymerase elongation subunit (family B)